MIFKLVNTSNTEKETLTLKLSVNTWIFKIIAHNSAQSILRTKLANSFLNPALKHDDDRNYQTMEVLTIAQKKKAASIRKRPSLIDVLKKSLSYRCSFRRSSLNFIIRTSFEGFYEVVVEQIRLGDSLSCHSSLCQPTCF